MRQVARLVPKAFYVDPSSPGVWHALQDTCATPNTSITARTYTVSVCALPLGGAEVYLFAQPAPKALATWANASSTGLTASRVVRYALAPAAAAMPVTLGLDGTQSYDLHGGAVALYLWTLDVPLGAAGLTLLGSTTKSAALEMALGTTPGHYSVALRVEDTLWGEERG